MAVDAPALRRFRNVKIRIDDGAPAGSFTALVSDYTRTYDIGWGWQERILLGAFTDSIEAEPTKPINWEHAWRDGPIGHAEFAEMELGIIARGLLYVDMDPKVARIYASMRAGATDEWSIGFGVDLDDILNTDDEPYVDQIQRGDLIEASLCYRGANPGTKTLDLRGQPIDLSRQLVTVAARREGAGPLTDPGSSEEFEREVVRIRTRFGRPEPRLRGAIPYVKTGTTDGTWSASAELKKLGDDPSEAQLRAMHAFVDPDKDATTKAAYSFPHHVVSDGEVGDANTTACSNGIARLNGGDGSEAWASSKAAIHSHLAKHLEDAGKDAPELKSAAGGARTEPPDTSEARRERSMSFGDQQSLVYAALVQHLGSLAEDDVGEVDIWIWDCADSWVVWKDYSADNYGLWRLGYSLDDAGAVAFAGDPEAVIMVTSYVPDPARTPVTPPSTRSVLKGLRAIQRYRAVRRRSEAEPLGMGGVDEEVESLALAIDQVVDEIEDALEDEDVAAAQALIAAADSTCDDLLEALGIEDEDVDDEPETTSEAAGLSPDTVNYLLSKPWGRAVLADRSASPAPPSPSNEPSPTGGPSDA